MPASYLGSGGLNLLYYNVVAAFAVQPVRLVYIVAMAQFIFTHGGYD
jgi:hypothetical protein